MFNLARSIVRHKVGFIAVTAFAVVVFSNSGPAEEEVKSSSPWAKDAPAAVAQTTKADGDTITGKLGAVANQAGEYAAEKLLGDKDLNPVAMGDQAVSNFEDANRAFAKANGNR